MKKVNFNLSKNSKITLAVLSGFVFAFVLIPVIVASAIPSIEYLEMTEYNGTDIDIDVHETEDGLSFYINVHRDETDEIETIEFEQYIIGVVAAEMPALFEMDALRAQAIAARTYAMRILQHQDYILDTVRHQVFLDEEQLKARWGDSFDTHFATIETAVKSTRGLVLKYDSELITPMFFSMSSGATENSEEVFSSERPYLRSVASLGYETHDSFSQSETFTINELGYILGDSNISANNISILVHSTGGNVGEIRIGDSIYTGREIRERLGLRSAAFSIEISDDLVTFTTYGHGHGVGMSQHGANVMAGNGHCYEEILTHFYQNVEITKLVLAESE